MKAIVLDERGDQLSSPARPTHGTWRDQVRDIAFAIGGAYGMTEDVRQRVTGPILSAMVFPHQPIRVLFVQLYRGLSILKGTGYHHG